MGEKWSKVFIFLAGATIGSLSAWQITKTIYKKIADDEINDMRNYFNEKLDAAMEVDEEELFEEKEEVQSKPDIDIYKEAVEDLGYVNYSDVEQKENNAKGKQKVRYTNPYVISPDDFGNIDEYDQVSLIYYDADGYLAFESGELVKDVEDLVGWDSLSTFGEYEDDAVHVRNEELKTDYEILRDLGSWSDIGNDQEE